MPVTDLTRPSEVEDEHFGADRSCACGSGIGSAGVDSRVVSPGIEHYVWKLVRIWSGPGQNIFSESLRAKAGLVPIAVVETYKRIGYSKCVARRDGMIEIHQLRVEPQRSCVPVVFCLRETPAVEFPCGHEPLVVTVTDSPPGSVVG